MRHSSGVGWDRDTAKSVLISGMSAESTHEVGGLEAETDGLRPAVMGWDMVVVCSESGMGRD
jgi:hypothetical protein